MKKMNMDRFKRVKIKRINKELPMPEYKTDGSCAFDLYASVTKDIQPGKLERIPSNLIVKVPEEYMMVIEARSSTLKNYGLSIQTGIIDNDYHGPQDEILIQAYNITNKIVRVKKGERIAQAYFTPVYKPTFVEFEDLGEKNRGGFGSTGRD